MRKLGPLPTILQGCFPIWIPTTCRRPIWGPQAANPHFVLPEPLAPPEPPASERYPWIITVAVIAAAIAVGGLLFGFIKQAKKSLPPPA